MQLFLFDDRLDREIGGHRFQARADHPKEHGMRLGDGVTSRGALGQRGEVVVEEPVLVEEAPVIEPLAAVACVAATP